MTDEYEAVFWDIGGVILDLSTVEAGQRRFVAALLDEHAVEMPVGEALATWKRAVGAYFRERDGTEYRSAIDAYARGVEAVVGERLPESEWRPLFDDRAREGLATNPGAEAAVERLAAADLHQGVVSDVDTDAGRDILGRFGLLEHFDSVTTSEEVGRTKPDPLMFGTALEKAGVEPERSVMVGDRYRHDVAGAADAGLTAVAYGADDGPLVDHRIEHLTEVLAVVGVDAADP